MPINPSTQPLFDTGLILQELAALSNAFLQANSEKIIERCHHLAQWVENARFSDPGTPRLVKTVSHAVYWIINTPGNEHLPFTPEQIRSINEAISDLWTILSEAERMTRRLDVPVMKERKP